MITPRKHAFQDARHSFRLRPEAPFRGRNAADLSKLYVRFEDVNRPGPFDYSRSGNPTRKALEDCLAALEGGTHGFAFSTGMAAETTALMLLESGDRILVHGDLYGGTYRLLETVFRNKGISAEYLDLRDIEAVQRAFERPAAAVWIETPTTR